MLRLVGGNLDPGTVTICSSGSHCETWHTEPLLLRDQVCGAVVTSGTFLYVMSRVHSFRLLWLCGLWAE